MIGFYSKLNLDIVGRTTAKQASVRLAALAPAVYRGVYVEGDLVFEFLVSFAGPGQISGSVRVNGKSYTLSAQEAQTLDTAISTCWRNVALPGFGIADITFIGDI
jgi:hypothetical protein